MPLRQVRFVPTADIARAMRNRWDAI